MMPLRRLTTKDELKPPTKSSPKWVKELGIKKVKNHQRFSSSKYFSNKAPISDAKTLFIPGCSLVGYDTQVLQQTYGYLVEQLGDVEMLVNCCGSPSLAIGDMDAYQDRSKRLKTIIAGHHIERIILACGNCYNTYIQELPEVEILTLWEVIATYGVPKDLKEVYTGKIVAALHDPCSFNRHSGVHGSVREILKVLGVTVEEFPANRNQATCCGSKNMIKETNPHLWQQLRSRRAATVKSQQILSYCQSCVRTLSVEGKTTLHLLDLLFNEEVISGRRGKQKPYGLGSTWAIRRRNARYNKRHVMT